MDTVVRNTKKLLASPPTLTPTDLYETINIIIPILDNDNNSTQSQDNIVKIASFLSCLRTSGLDHKAEYIAQAARAVLNYSDLVPSPCNDNSNIVVMDIVGTGGDGQNTFNVSTSSSNCEASLNNLKEVLLLLFLSFGLLLL